MFVRLSAANTRESVEEHLDGLILSRSTRRARSSQLSLFGHEMSIKLLRP